MGVKIKLTLRRTNPNAFKWLLKVQKEVEQLNKGGVTVGIHPEDDMREDGKSNSTIAAIHEFGDRPFFRPTLARQAPARLKINAIYKEGLQKALRGQGTIRAAQIKAGKMMVAALKDTIDRGVPPPNAPSTIRRKGHGRTLRDTLQMRDALKYKIKGE